MRHENGESRRNDQGFALVLALLALLLLTTLGLTLALTTSTEQRIATNYRWSRQAFYNAEAGVEAGRRILRDVSWDAVLPAPRYSSWPAAGPYPAAPTAPFSGATRDYESAACDQIGGQVGYGVVLNDGTQPY